MARRFLNPLVALQALVREVFLNGSVNLICLFTLYNILGDLLKENKGTF